MPTRFSCIRLPPSVRRSTPEAHALSLLHEVYITEREAHFVYAAITDKTLESAPQDKRDTLRADILRAFLLTLRTLKYKN